MQKKVPHKGSFINLFLIFIYLCDWTHKATVFSLLFIICNFISSWSLGSLGFIILQGFHSHILCCICVCSSGEVVCFLAPRLPTDSVPPPSLLPHSYPLPLIFSAVSLQRDERERAANCQRSRFLPLSQVSVFRRGGKEKEQALGCTSGLWTSLTQLL